MLSYYKINGRAYYDGKQIYKKGTILPFAEGKVAPKSAKLVSEGDYLAQQAEDQKDAQSYKAQMDEMRRSIMKELQEINKTDVASLGPELEDAKGVGEAPEAELDLKPTPAPKPQKAPVQKAAAK